jgi:hypothetical protein
MAGRSNGGNLRAARRDPWTAEAARGLPLTQPRLSER